MREHKLTTINDRIFLYPVPVIKEKKYLIEIENEMHAVVFNALIQSQVIRDPLEQEVNYQKIEQHSDGKTWIYKLNNETLHLLANREVNSQRAETVEKVLTKKIWSILEANSESSRIEACDNLLKVYKAQLNCSECQKMGITEIPIKKFINLLN